MLRLGVIFASLKYPKSILVTWLAALVAVTSPVFASMSRPCVSLNCTGGSIPLASHTCYEARDCGCTPTVMLLSSNFTSILEGTTIVAVNSLVRVASMRPFVESIAQFYFEASDVRCAAPKGDDSGPLVSLVANSHVVDVAIIMSNLHLTGWDINVAPVVNESLWFPIAMIILHVLHSVISNATLLMSESQLEARVPVLSIAPNASEGLHNINVTFRSVMASVTLQYINYESLTTDTRPSPEAKQWCLVGAALSPFYGDQGDVDFKGIRNMSNVVIRFEGSTLTCLQEILFPDPAPTERWQCDTTPGTPYANSELYGVILRIAPIGTVRNVAFFSVGNRWNVTSVAKVDLMACPSGVSAGVILFSSDVFAIGQLGANFSTSTDATNVVVVSTSDTFHVSAARGACFLYLAKAVLWYFNVTAVLPHGILNAIGDTHPLVKVRSALFVACTGLKLHNSNIVVVDGNLSLRVVSGVWLGSKYLLPPAWTVMFYFTSGVVGFDDTMYDSVVLIRNCSVDIQAIDGAFGPRPDYNKIDVSWSLLFGSGTMAAVALPSTTTSDLQRSNFSAIDVAVRCASSFSVSRHINITRFSFLSSLDAFGATYGCITAVMAILSNMSGCQVVVERSSLHLAAPASAMALGSFEDPRVVFVNISGLVVLSDLQYLLTTRFMRSMFSAMISASITTNSSTSLSMSGSAKYATIALRNSDIVVDADGGAQSPSVPLIVAGIWTHCDSYDSRINVSSVTITGAARSAAIVALVAPPLEANATLVSADVMLEGVVVQGLGSALLGAVQPLWRGTHLNVKGGSVTVAQCVLAGLNSSFSSMIPHGPLLSESVNFTSQSLLSIRRCAFTSFGSMFGSPMSLVDGNVFIGCDNQWEGSQLSYASLLPPNASATASASRLSIGGKCERTSASPQHTAVEILRSSVAAVGGAFSYFLGQSLVSCSICAQVSSASRLMSCENDPADGGSSIPFTDLMSNPLQLRLPLLLRDDDSLSYAAGATIGNAVVCFAMLVVATAFRHKEKLRFLQLRKIIAAATFPERTFLSVWGILLLPSTSAALNLLLTQASVFTSKRILVGAVAFAFWTAPVAYWAARTLYRFPHESRATQVKGKHSRANIALLLFEETSVWRRPRSAALRRHAMRYGSLFLPYRGGLHWYFVVDWALSLLVASTSTVGTAFTGNLALCRGAQWVIVALTAAALALTIALRPHSVLYELFTTAMLQFTAILAAVFDALEMSEASQIVSIAQTVALLLSLGVAAVANVLVRRSSQEAWVPSIQPPWAASLTKNRDESIFRSLTALPSGEGVLRELIIVICSMKTDAR